MNEDIRIILRERALFRKENKKKCYAKCKEDNTYKCFRCMLNVKFGNGVFHVNA